MIKALQEYVNDMYPKEGYVVESLAQPEIGFMEIYTDKTVIQCEWEEFAMFLIKKHCEWDSFEDNCVRQKTNITNQ